MLAIRQTKVLFVFMFQLIFIELILQNKFIDNFSFQEKLLYLHYKLNTSTSS